jgi:hypothetical protein
MAIAKWRVGPNQAIKTIEEKSEGQVLQYHISKRYGLKILFFTIGKFLGEKEKGGILRIQNSGDTILNSTRFAE